MACASSSVESVSYIFFDLETTGLERTSDITQIAARQNDDDTFNVYVRPDTPWELNMKEQNKNCSVGIRMHESNPAVNLYQALEWFINYLQSHSNVVLLGHNAKSFDCHVLINAARSRRMLKRLESVFNQCVDTLLVIRELYPNLGLKNKKVTKDKKHPYKLENLALEYAGAEVDISQLHDASVDAEALEIITTKLILQTRKGQQTLPSHYFSLSDLYKI